MAEVPQHFPGSSTPPLPLAPATAVDAENPWPGLASFTEDARGFFFGRELETEELFRLVRRETLSVLFGQSGLGKSSLVQAGLFPLLRATDHLPLYLRLDHGGTSAGPLADQVRAALTDAFQREKVDAPPFRPGETLWEYFHRKDVDLWSAKNRLLTPVLVFDQFEEVFTLGRADAAASERSREFLHELACLVENRMPAAAKEKFDRGELDPANFNFGKPSCHVLLSLREDFLPDLEGLKQEMPAVVIHRLRLKKLSGTQAREIVTKPAPHLLAEGVAERIVEFVAGARGGSPERLAELEVEPPLLSVICRELNERRRSLGQAQITADLVSGNRREILTDFYERSVADLPEAMRTFVEDRLLTKSGFRDNLALETALEQPGVTRALIDTLVSRRLLRIEERLGVQRVELTHDVLAEVVRASRDARQQRMAFEQARANERLTRRRMWLARGIAAGLLVVAGVAIWAAVWAVRRQQTEAQRWSRADMFMAGRFLDEGKVQESLAFLVHAARIDPKNTAIAPRLLSTLTTRSFAMPHGDVLRLRPNPNLDFRSVTFAGDSSRFGALGADRMYQIVDFESGRVEREIQLPVSEERAFFMADTVFAYTYQKGMALFDAASGTLRGRLATGEPWLNGTSSRNGRWYAFWSAKAVYVFDAQTCALKAVLPHDGEVTSSRVSSDGQRVISVEKDRRSAWLWIWVDGKYVAAELPPVEEGPVKWGIFSDDGRVMAVGQPGGIQLRDVATGRARGAFLSFQAAADSTAAAFTPDGTKLLARGTTDREVKIWDVSSGTEVASLLHPRAVMSIAASADSQRVMTSGGDRHHRVWDIATGRQVVEGFRRPDEEQVTIAPDGRRLVRARKNGEVYRYWLEKTEARPLALRRPNYLMASLWDPDRPAVWRWVTRDAVQDWDVARGEKIAPDLALPERISSCIVSRDGRVFFVRTAAGPHQAWRRSGDRWEITAVPDYATGTAVRTKLSDDGEMALVLGAPAENQIQVWSLRTGKPVSPVMTYKAPLFTEGGDFSPDGRFVAAGSRQGEGKVWEIATGRLVHDLQPLTASVRRVAWSPDGRHLATVEMLGRGARLWHAASGRPASPPLYHYGRSTTTTPAGFSRDGRWMMDFSQSLGTVRVWNVRTGEPVGSQIEHGSRVRFPVFSPDGSQVATAGVDGAVRLWDTQTGQLIAEPFRHSKPVSRVAYSPDGRFIVSVCDDGLDRIWSAPLERTGTTPDWLLRLATMHAGLHVGDDGNLADLITNEQGALYVLRREVLALPDNAPFARWGKWLFADRKARPLAPGFVITTAEAEARGLVAATVAPTDPAEAEAAPDAARGADLGR